MNENELKKAFDAIEPENGAKERMYANILKKAAAQKAVRLPESAPAEEKSAPQKRRSAPAWHRWGSLAACLALVAAIGLALPRLTQHAEPDDSALLGGAPFEDVQSAADFEDLGFTIDAPENAEDVSYCILDGEIAQVTFSLDGHSYTYRASKLDGDFSGDTEDAVGSISLNAKYNAVLDRLSPDSWRAHWSHDTVSYYLTNFDGAGEEAITAAVNGLLG